MCRSYELLLSGVLAVAVDNSASAVVYLPNRGEIPEMYLAS